MFSGNSHVGCGANSVMAQSAEARLACDQSKGTLKKNREKRWGKQELSERRAEGSALHVAAALSSPTISHIAAFLPMQTTWYLPCEGCLWQGGVTCCVRKWNRGRERTVTLAQVGAWKIPPSLIAFAIICKDEIIPLLAH